MVSIKFCLVRTEIYLILLPHRDYFLKLYYRQSKSRDYDLGCPPWLLTTQIPKVHSTKRTLAYFSIGRERSPAGVRVIDREVHHLVLPRWCFPFFGCQNPDSAEFFSLYDRTCEKFLFEMWTFLSCYSMNYRDFSVKSKLLISLFQTLKLSLKISLFEK